jgi:hypothetical protein
VDAIGAPDVHAVAAGSAGSILIRGSDGDDLVVARVAADGTVLPAWRWTAPDGLAYGYDIVGTVDGGAVIAGADTQFGGGYATVRFDAAGTVLFADIEPGDLGNPLGVSRVAIDADDATIVGAAPESTFGKQRAQLWKIAADGTRLWTKKMPDLHGDAANLSLEGLVLAPNGDVIVSLGNLVSQSIQSARVASEDGAILSDSVSTAPPGQPISFARAASGRALVGGFYRNGEGASPDIVEFAADGKACRIEDDPATVHGVIVAHGGDGWYVLGSVLPINANPVVLQRFDDTGPCDPHADERVFASGFDAPI